MSALRLSPASGADASYEKGETQSFYNDFFSVFGVRRRMSPGSKNGSTVSTTPHGYIDPSGPACCWSSRRSAGRSLEAAREQAGDYFDALPERGRPRYQLLCDFQTFELLVGTSGRSGASRSPTCPTTSTSSGSSSAWRNAPSATRIRSTSSAELMGALHDALKESGYGGHDLQQFLVRTVFCLFADNTGIFDRGQLLAPGRGTLVRGWGHRGWAAD